MLSKNRIKASLQLIIVGLVLVASQLVAARTGNDSSSVLENSPLRVQEIVSRLQECNHARTAALLKFNGTRVYRLQYRGFLGDRDAEMTVSLVYTFPDRKVFTVLSESGSRFVIDHILKGLLEAEKEAATSGNQLRTALNGENYEFSLAGTESSENGQQYVLNVIPKTDNKFLYRGRIWVDANDFAVTRLEAEPAKSPSFWVKKSQISVSYEKVNGFWLPAENRTRSWIRLGGYALLSIDYRDYAITETAPLNKVESALNSKETSTP